MPIQSCCSLINGFCFQYNSNGWYVQLGSDNSPRSEAILDRIKHDTYKINIIPTNSAIYRFMSKVHGLDPALSKSHSIK